MKKIIAISVYLLIISFGLVLISCDDSGVTPPGVPSGRVTLKVPRLKPLDGFIDGVYQLWLHVNDTLGNAWVSPGRFNLLADGTIVDLSGNPIVWIFGRDTTRIGNMDFCIVSLELGPLNTTPGPSHILAGPITVYPDSIGGPLTFNNNSALGSVGTKLMSGERGRYTLQVITSATQSCVHGLWMCDSNGMPFLPDGINLSPGGGWIYEGWVYDSTAQNYRSTGKFYRRDTLDLDGPGACADIIPPVFNVPGQEWVKNNPGCPDPASFTLRDGHHSVFITIEPEYRAGALPFFLRVYEQNLISSTLGCGYQDNLFNQPWNIPYGRVQISRFR